MLVPATQADAERIARLHIASWHATYGRTQERLSEVRYRKLL